MTITVMRVIGRPAEEVPLVATMSADCDNEDDNDDNNYDNNQLRGERRETHTGISVFIGPRLINISLGNIQVGLACVRVIIFLKGYAHIMNNVEKESDAAQYQIVWQSETQSRSLSDLTRLPVLWRLEPPWLISTSRIQLWWQNKRNEGTENAWRVDTSASLCMLCCWFESTQPLTLSFQATSPSLRWPS